MHCRFHFLARTALLLPALAAARLALGASAQSSGPDVALTLERTPHPDSAAQFDAATHFPCLNQGRTSVCWSFATSSFVESEMARLHRPSVHLSVMYPVYTEFLEKARRYVQMKGESRFSPGDLFTGVEEACQFYGALPASVYDKPENERRLPDQHRLYAELDKLMDQTKARGDWNEQRVLGEVQRILNRRLGKPPKLFTYQGKTYTPRSFAEAVVALPWTNYILLTSFEYAPFDRLIEFRVPDNWHHNTNYLNLPLPLFYESFKSAVRAGYSVAVSIDTTEPSYKETGRYCIIPDSELSPAQITQSAREHEFQAGATTDDHAIHIIGYHDFDGQDWFLAKDSWKTTWQHGNQGCLFLHSSYVKMKILAFMVHRDGLPEDVKRLLAACHS